MTARVQGRVAWSLAVVAAAAVLVGVALAPAAVRWGQATGALPGLAFAGMGGMIVSRRDGNVIGWLLVVAGASFAVADFANLYAYRGLVADPGGLPAARWAAWATTWTWGPGFAAGLLLLPLVFPTGRLPSPRWRPFAATVVTALALQMVLLALRPGQIALNDPLSHSDVRAGGNPLGLPGLASASAAVDMVVQVAFLPMLLVLVAVVTRRYRRAVGVERYQLRWFLLAVALLPITFLLSALAGGAVVLQTATDVLLGGVPVSIGIAVLRYRLFEIDRLVSRTVTYAIVSAVLIGVYTLVVTLPSAAFELESDLLVASATLVVAGLFVPVRRRVQEAVDRRFNRSRYDAQRVIERFGDRLRDDLDIDSLAMDLQRTVRSSIQPAHVSLWLPEVSP